MKRILGLLIVVILYVSTQSWGVESIIGTWESKSREQLTSKENLILYTVRTVKIGTRDYSFKRTVYEDRAPGSLPIFEQELVGTYTQGVNSYNNKVINLDLTIAKNLVTVKQQSSKLSSFDLGDCAKVNVTVDVSKVPCGSFSREVAMNKLYFDVLPLNSRMMILGNWWKPFAKTTERRPISVNLFPLIKK